MTRSRRLFPAALLPLAAAGCSPTALRELERLLNSRDSATAALAQWCAARGIAAPPRIVAQPVVGDDAPLPSDARRLLSVPETASLGYRHVRLACGDVILSEAHNWFVPARLTDDMNAALATTNTPFGTVVAPLHFTRERLDTRRGREEGCPPGTVLAQRALLRRPDGQPISLVVECYQEDALVRSG
ncbi:hypothetical protein ACFSTD_06305 [Novosphingobium colocasiae]|uniref:Chorismate lyase n=1 Tax=Novosphingobium colocasiae TaxID=1256513 RepID=A0A918PGE2_9SPHN|nr:hypothetical protein [Novosphingobium colocasiae]GGZ06203.1 hypothetical protein GCM10011614_21390 [Novosphingobium colocasiae]